MTRKNMSKNLKAKREKQHNATDVGLEPTASALGGLRATIAPTGRFHVDEDFFMYKIYMLSESTIGHGEILSMEEKFACRQ